MAIRCREYRAQDSKGFIVLSDSHSLQFLLDCIKIFTYNMEKQMCKLLLNHYDVQKEIYPALAMIIKRGAYVKLRYGELTVRLGGFKNPEIDYAARHLCEDLNEMKPATLDKFRLPIHYEVA